MSKTHEKLNKYLEDPRAERDCGATISNVLGADSRPNPPQALDPYPPEPIHLNRTCVLNGINPKYPSYEPELTVCALRMDSLHACTKVAVHPGNTFLYRSYRCR